MRTDNKLNPFAAVALYGGLGLIVLAFLIVSGVANVNVWWNSAEGWARYVFTTIGIGAEGWGALGLLLMTRRFMQGQWLKAFICLALWLPAVAFNGYSTYRFFSIEGASISVAGAVDKTTLELAQNRIPEITRELDTIGVTRTPETITAERDQLPSSYRTRRAELNAELSTATRRATLETELAATRSTVLDKAGATAAPTDKAISDARIWIALVIWMEAVKALALWVMFGRVSPAKADEIEQAIEHQGQGTSVAPAASVGNSERVIYTPEGEERRIRAL